MHAKIKNLKVLQPVHTKVLSELNLLKLFNYLLQFKIPISQELDAHRNGRLATMTTCRHWSKLKCYSAKMYTHIHIE